jgi:hypothetical protein
LTGDHQRINAVDAEMLYRQLGRLIETAPTFQPHPDALTPDQQQWLGRARALVVETGDLTLGNTFTQVIAHVHGPARMETLPMIMQHLYHALALA